MSLVTKPNSNGILQKYLKSHGITQHFVANKMGVSDQSLSNLLNGRSKFTADKAIMVSKALGISLDIFLEKSYTK